MTDVIWNNMKSIYSLFSKILLLKNVAKSKMPEAKFKKKMKDSFWKKLRDRVDWNKIIFCLCPQQKLVL